MPAPIHRAGECDRRAFVQRLRELHEALRALDRIAPADPLRPDADRLRGDIQRGLLAAAGSLTLIPGAVVIYFVRNYIAKGFALGRV